MNEMIDLAHEMMMKIGSTGLDWIVLYERLSECTNGVFRS